MIEEPELQSGGKWRRYMVAAAVVLVFVSAAYGMYRLVNGEPSPRKRVIEVMALKLVPPPPPPPPKEEPPPPPPKIVQRIEPPPTPDMPQDDAPPADAPIGLDAQGGAGSDAFGLAAKPGGTPLRLGGGGGGGGGTGVNYTGYGNMMRLQIESQLNRDSKINTGKYEGIARVWLSSIGKVERVQVQLSTGNTQLGTLIEQSIGTMPPMTQAPPKEMPQPVILHIVAAAR
jgi:protein TonB